MIQMQPPVSYRTVSGGIRTAERVGDWPYPRMEYRDGTWWLELPDTQDWRHLGWGPRPRTRARRFIGHVCHGVLMGYPLRAVLAFALDDLRRALDE